MDDIRCTFSYPYSDYPYVAVETGLYILYSKIVKYIRTNYKLFQITQYKFTINRTFYGFDSYIYSI